MHPRVQKRDVRFLKHQFFKRRATRWQLAAAGRRALRCGRSVAMFPIPTTAAIETGAATLLTTFIGAAFPENCPLRVLGYSISAEMTLSDT
jgi:hypothetical protein